jgi:hypothetical protein
VPRYDHTKFQAYWESIGKPKLECSSSNMDWADVWKPTFWPGYKYRIENDPHAELKQRWIDSDFKLRIEWKEKAGEVWWEIRPPAKVNRYPDLEYREVTA